MIWVKYYHPAKIVKCFLILLKLQILILGILAFIFRCIIIAKLSLDKLYTYNKRLRINTLPILIKNMEKIIFNEEDKS